jgi:hypothetical protein
LLPQVLFSFSLGQYTTVFQAEVHAFKHLLLRILKGAIGKVTFIFPLVVKHSLYGTATMMILAEHNNVQLLWVPGQKVMEGNEISDQLAKRGLLASIYRT